MINAKETLISFIKEMNIWENSYRNALMGDDAVDKNEYLSELNRIFTKWCTIKERKNGRQSSMKVSFPPDYDPENDEIVSELIEKNKAFFIIKKHTGFENSYRYTLLYKNNEWRIDKKEWLNEKWEKCSL